MTIEPGIVNEVKMTVEETDTARASGGETLPPVLSTPRMISYMERSAHEALLPYFTQGQTSVGSEVNIRHLAATPVGMTVRFRAELTSVDGRRMCFKVEAWDEVDKIGEGQHERFIIDEGRFYERLKAKQAKIGQKPA